MTYSAPLSPLNVRVGLLESYERLTFMMNGRYRIETLTGEELRASGTSDLRWRTLIESSTPAQILYSVLVASYQRQTEAMELAEKFESDGLPTVVRQIGGPIEIDGRVVGDNTLYRVQVGNFQTEEDARVLLNTLDMDYAPRMVREVIRNSKGKIELFDADLVETYEFNNAFRLIPEDMDSKVTIFGIRVNSGFHYEKTVDREYSGMIEIYVDHEGKLAAFTEVPIDIYLRGVVPAEMPAAFPEETLRAQAIMARSVVMAQKSIKHLNDPYELCAHVHCQVYSGLSDVDERTAKAVDDTRGMVLTYNGLLVDSHFSAVCGGHTEDVTQTWLTPPLFPSKGVPCSCNDEMVIPDLSTEAGAGQWIKSRPEVCCNLQNYDLPVSSDYGRRHFRWEVSYTRAELEEIIMEKTGQDVGVLYDIVPIRRGVSGRLMEIEILGSRKNLRIRRELKIRRALSKTALESSCFLIDVIHDERGNPMEIIFTGAGWGHGVGMCQCGAARMAADGKTYTEIIEHYYPGCEIQKKYN
jgi:peptidoglycan hydrolase-like amidase